VPTKKENLLQRLTAAADIAQEQKHVNIDMPPIQNQKQQTEAKQKSECLAAVQTHGKTPITQAQHEG